MSKKIAFFSHASDLYGAPRSLLLLLTAIDFEKYDPFVICPNDGLLVERIKALGIRAYIIRRTWENKHVRNRYLRKIISLSARLKYIIRLTHLLFTEKASLVYVNTVSHASPIIPAKILGIPTLVHVRESSPSYFSFRGIKGKLRYRVILRFPNEFIAVSQAVKSILLDKGVPDYKTTVVYNGVDISKFRYSVKARKKSRETLGLADTNIIVGTVANLRPKKGIEDFIKAARIVHTKDKCVRFVIVGGGIPLYLTRLRRMCYNYNLKSCCIFTGMKKDVMGYFSAMDVFVNASIKDAFARVNLEAMATERAVIATDTDGNPEAILNGETGYIVPVGNPQRLANHILQLVKDSKLRTHFGKAGRQRVEKYFTIDHYYKGVERVLNQVLDKY